MSQSLLSQYFALIKKRHDRGASLVEAAIILPVLILVVVGIIQIGFVLAAYITLRNASAAGARVGIVKASTATSDRAAFDAYVTNAVIASIVPLDPARVVVPAAVLTPDSPPKVTVTVNYSLPLFPGSEMVLGVAGNLAMSTSTTMR